MQSVEYAVYIFSQFAAPVKRVAGGATVARRTCDQEVVGSIPGRSATA